MSETKKPREFIAYKRTTKSFWLYEEYSEEVDRAIDAIAPEGGNFCKLRLIEKSAYDKAIEALKNTGVCKCYQSRPHKPDNEPKEPWKWNTCYRCQTLKELGELV